VLSPLPYAVSFGLLPAFATLSRPQPALPAWWAVAAGALLGIAAHIANVLRDLDDDGRTGVRGLPHRLPPWLDLGVGWAALLGAAVVLAIGIGLDAPVALVGLAAAVVVAVTGVVLSLRRASRWGFRLVLVAALLDVGLLVAGGASLVPA
jgi:4-hydroxybenzoate polyprenyltransferase